MNSDPRDYKLDISSLSQSDDTEAAPAKRPFLSVLFECCGVYQRVYRDPVARAYEGRCPRCGRGVKFPVGEGGTQARFFRAR